MVKPCTHIFLYTRRTECCPFFSKKKRFPFSLFGVSKLRGSNRVCIYSCIQEGQNAVLKKNRFSCCFPFVSKLCCSSHVCIYSKIQGGQNAVFFGQWKKTVFLFTFVSTSWCTNHVRKWSCIQEGQNAVLFFGGGVKTKNFLLFYGFEIAMLKTCTHIILYARRTECCLFFLQRKLFLYLVCAAKWTVWLKNTDTAWSPTSQSQQQKRKPRALPCNAGPFIDTCSRVKNLACTWEFWASMATIGRERGKGQIGKIPGPSPSKSGKSQKHRESPRKDKKGRTSPDRETPPGLKPPPV